MTSPVPAGTLRDEAVEAVAAWLVRKTYPKPYGSTAWDLVLDADELREAAEDLLDLPAVARVVAEARADGARTSRAELGRAWDAGNCVGLDGWIGPDRGEEPDPEAISARERDVNHLLSLRAAVRQTDEGNDR